MSFEIRSNSTNIYRLIFISLFLLLGISCIAVVGLDYYAGISLIASEQPDTKEAFYATALFMGLLGLVTACMMIFLLQERRGSDTDRRQNAQPLDFIDRRTEIDRRSE